MDHARDTDVAPVPDAGRGGDRTSPADFSVILYVAITGGHGAVICG